MRTVKQILQTKGAEVWTVAPDSTVYEALKLMADKNIGALPVVEGEQLVGIISERDYARKIIRQDQISMTTPVSKLMTKRVYYVGPENTIEDCMGLMSNKRIRHLPVLEDDRMVGIISIGDVVQTIISTQEFIIEQLEKYIVGGG